MEPTIQTGALVIVKPTDKYEIQDIVTYKTPNSTKKNDFTTHRIIEVNEKEGGRIFVTKGDANEETDTNQIKEGDIIGKEFLSIALLGYLLGYIKTLPGLLIVIIIPAVIIIYEEVNKIKREAQKIIEERTKKIKKANNAKNK
jgi:signal peptidase